MTNKSYYKVCPDPRRFPICDHLLHGYESPHDFYNALKGIVARYGDRIGESVSERNGFQHLLFHDTPDGYPDEAWLPQYLLEEEPLPDADDADNDAEIEQELDKAFGFE